MFIRGSAGIFPPFTFEITHKDSSRKEGITISKIGVSIHSDTTAMSGQGAKIVVNKDSIYFQVNTPGNLGIMSILPTGVNFHGDSTMIYNLKLQQPSATGSNTVVITNAPASNVEWIP